MTGLLVKPVMVAINSLCLATRLEDAQFLQHLPRCHHLVELRLAGFGELLALFLLVALEAGQGEVEGVEVWDHLIAVPLAAEVTDAFLDAGRDRLAFEVQLLGLEFAQRLLELVQQHLLVVGLVHRNHAFRVGLNSF